MKTWQTLAIIAGLCVAVPVGCSFMNAATSVATAPARVINKTMQTNNIIANYEYFREASQNFVARKAQIVQYKAFMADDSIAPDEKSRLRVELSGIQQSCRDLAAEYNGRTLMLNRNVFKGSDVPEVLNPLECE